MRPTRVRGANLVKTGQSFNIDGATLVRVRNNYPSRIIYFGFSKNEQKTVQLLPDQEDTVPLPADSAHVGEIYVEIGAGEAPGHVQVLATFPTESETSR